MWHCFGCGAGHSIFDFVMKIEGVEFGDALRILAQRAGVELKPFRPEIKGLETKRARLYEILESAGQFFEKQLGQSTVGKEAEDYLLGRGISPESIKNWRLGYSPDTWNGLNDFLVSRGYQNQEIEAAGLVIKKDQGGFYDRFRGRIMFPIFDLNSQIIGFGGRVFSQKDAKETAKYINTPATLLYDKSRTLYGLERAKMEIRQKDNCVLVEGYTDAILAHQAGTTNAVAVSGTALTPWHLKILRRYTENLLISFDMDLAGDTATKRGIDLALGQSFNLRVVILPEGKDPAELVVKSPGAWEKAVEQARSIMEFYFETTLKKFAANEVSGKKEISKTLLPIIKRIPNKIEQTFWLQKLASEIEAKESDLAEEMAKIKSEEEFLGLEPEEIVSQPVKTRRELLEERFLTLVLKNRSRLEKLIAEDLGYLSPETQLVVKTLKESVPENQKFDQFEQKTQEKINYLLLKIEALPDFSEKDQALDFEQCWREIKGLELKMRLEEISSQLNLAEKGREENKSKTLLEKFNQLAKKLSELTS
jgi:DNA primase